MIGEIIMNETLKNIKNRRSVRAYQAEQIKEAELQLILEAGMYAPSARNQQSWHFTVIQDKELMNEISKAAQEEYKKSNDKFIQQFANNENFHIFHKAPTAVIISGDENSMVAQTDCALATENMLIAAESVGIGSCWVSAASNIINTKNDAELNNQLCIPKGFKPIYSITLGYKATETINDMPRKADIVNYVR
jgi:nitroreductase